LPQVAGRRNQSRVAELGYEEHARRCLTDAKQTFGDRQITLRSGSSIAGAVRLSGGKDAAMVENGAGISAATLFDGRDGNEDNFTFSGFAGALGTLSFANWENVIAENSSD